MVQHINITDIVKQYTMGSEDWTFGPVSFSASGNESVCILGASGGGKSTFLHLFAGLDVLDRGEILIDGVDISGLSSQEMLNWRKKNIGFVFQDFHLFDELSVFENIRLSLDISGEYADEVITELVNDAIGEVGLDGKAGHLPSQLSGGQRQRVAIARAIVHKPSLLLADEPTGSLDSVTGTEILDVLFSVAEHHGMGFWCVTHDTELKSRFDTVLYVRDGKLEDSY